MRPSRRPCLYAFVLLLCAAHAPRAHADALTITTDPPGATVEIDGLVSATTPSHTDLPGGYFHKTHTAFTARLEHPIVVRLSKQGYLSQQVTLTEGPFEWVAITGRRRGNYFLLKSDHFHFTLRPISERQDISSGPVAKEGPILTATRPEKNEVVDSAAKPGTGNVSVSSDLPGCEIYVDGKFVGQTPSSFSLDVGTHRIEVKASGKQTWERTLEVLANSQVNLRAVLADRN